MGRLILVVFLATAAIAAACVSSSSKKATPTTKPAATTAATTAARTPGVAQAQCAPATPTAAPASPPALTLTPTVTADNLQIMVVQPGSGATAEAGKFVCVAYTGWLSDGTKFDSSLDRGQLFGFAVGTGRVIKGWDEGVVGMKVGEKRRLIIPPALGYGAGGSPPVIPANATLIFDVQLLDVK